MIIRLLLQLFRPKSHTPPGLGLPIPPNFASEIRRHALNHCPLRPGADGTGATVTVAGQTGSESLVAVLAAVDVAVCELVAIVIVRGTSDGGSSAAVTQGQIKSFSGVKRPVEPQYVWYRPVHDMALQLLTDESAAVALKGVAAADGIASFDTGCALVKVAQILLSISQPADANEIWYGLTALFRRSRARETIQRHLFKLWEAGTLWQYSSDKRQAISFPIMNSQYVPECYRSRRSMQIVMERLATSTLQTFVGSQNIRRKLVVRDTLFANAVSSSSTKATG